MSLMKAETNDKNTENFGVRATAKFWQNEWSSDESDDGQNAGWRKKERKRETRSMIVPKGHRLPAITPEHSLSRFGMVTNPSVNVTNV